MVLTGWAETVNSRAETVNPRAETVNLKASSGHVLRDFIVTSVPTNARWAIERFQSDDEGQSVADAIKKGCC